MKNTLLKLVALGMIVVPLGCQRGADPAAEGPTIYDAPGGPNQVPVSPNAPGPTGAPPGTTPAAPGLDGR
jgi:hypothetical protein